jgi:hypothetical protein
MSSSTLFTMVLIGAGSGALALAIVRALVLVFPRARRSGAAEVEPAASGSFRMHAPRV